MKGGRTGYTTGSCAAAAAKAAVTLLTGRPSDGRVEIPLPDGSRLALPLIFARLNEDGAEAAVRKDAGDDPDVTDGCTVKVSVSWIDGPDVAFVAGEGVGTVTKPGLSVPPGQPAINPVPREMIRSAMAEVTDRAVRVTVSIPGGRELAEKTFNPRLGVEGGLSILGTSGIVRPFSSEALRDALTCALSVAVGCKVENPVFVPGRIGEKAARRHFRFRPEQLIEVSNEWGFILDRTEGLGFKRLLALGHPGKLAKLIDGWWDTHSSRSSSAVPTVTRLAQELLGGEIEERRTVEGVLDALVEPDRKRVADRVAREIGRAIDDRVRARFPVSVVLVNMRGDLLGDAGDLSAWL